VRSAPCSRRARSVLLYHTRPPFAPRADLCENSVGFMPASPTVVQVHRERFSACTPLSRFSLPEHLLSTLSSPSSATAAGLRCACALALQRSPGVGRNWVGGWPLLCGVLCCAVHAVRHVAGSARTGRSWRRTGRRTSLAVPLCSSCYSVRGCVTLLRGLEIEGTYARRAGHGSARVLLRCRGWRLTSLPCWSAPFGHGLQPLHRIDPADRQLCALRRVSPRPSQSARCATPRRTPPRPALACC
jgi:hypothetical protein